MRPLNCLIAALSVYVGAFAAGVRWPGLDVCLAALSAAFIAGAGNAFNDVRDLDIDRINRPSRPLPAGHLTPRTALNFSIFLTLVGLALSWWLGPILGTLASAIVGALAMYSTLLKNKAFWGNFCIALISGLAFPYGALTTGALGRSWIAAGFAFLFHLGREIVKDIEDIEGDRAAGAGTLPLRWNPLQAAHLCSLIFLILILFTLLPWMLDLYGTMYLGTVVLVDLLLFYAIFQLHRTRAQLPDSRLAEHLKAGMLLGLLAIIAGELWR